MARAFSLDVDPVSISQCGFDDVVLAIDVTSNGGFADPVTLATIDLPAAASENFSSQSGHAARHQLADPG